MRTKWPKSEAQIWIDKFANFLSSLNKEEKDKILTAMALRSKLIDDLPQEYRRTHREYRELLFQNQELFQRQKLMIQ